MSQNDYNITLQPHHQAQLVKSGISDTVAKARGYRTVTSKQELAQLGFSEFQQRIPSLLIPQYSVNGGTSPWGYQIRPDQPRFTGIKAKAKPVKYESPSGQQSRLDASPTTRHLISDIKARLWFTEGAKKADALASRGECALSLVGVWGFKGHDATGSSVLLADFDLIPLQDRLVYLCFDSDWQTNSKVRQALNRLATHLRNKGAAVLFIRLPMNGKEKTGIDDYLAAGHTVEDAVKLAGESLDLPKTTATEIPGFHLTDMGNGKRLVALFGDRIRYNFERDKWLIWTGKRWEWDTGAAILRMAKQTAISIYAEASKEMGDKAREEIVAHAKASESSMKCKAMVEMGKSEDGVPVRLSELDNNDWLLNCDNGTVDLKTGILRPHERRDMITRLVPLEYDPDVKSEVWQKFLERIFNGNQELIEYVQRCLGYSITGDNSEMYFWFCYGLGWNGKSTLFHSVCETLGKEYAREVESSAFMTDDYRGGINEAIANLYKVRLVAATELTEGQKLDVALIKRMTGGEPLWHERKYEHGFDFSPNYKLFLCGNHHPVIRDTTNSLWFRLHKIPFTVTIPENERVPKFKEDLPREHGKAILAWLVKGCLEYQKQGLKRPEEVARATNEYRDNQDVLREYLEERGFIEPSASITVSDLYKDYKEWHENNGALPLGKTNFNERMRERSFKDIRGTANKLYWRGVRLRVPMDPDDQGKVTNYDEKVTFVTKISQTFTTRGERADFIEKELIKVTSKANVEANSKSNFSVTLVTSQDGDGQQVTTGVPAEDILSLWQKLGRPVIPLAVGAVADLETFLTGPVRATPEQEGIILKWYRGNKEG